MYIFRTTHATTCTVVVAQSYLRRRFMSWYGGSCSFQN